MMIVAILIMMYLYLNRFGRPAKTANTKLSRTKVVEDAIHNLFPRKVRVRVD